MNWSTGLRLSVLPVLAIFTVILLTVKLHRQMADHEISQISRITELESIAARGRLVRNLDTMLRSLQEVRSFWAANAHLPRDQWSSDTSLAIDRFDGIEFILWTDANQSIRHALTSAHPSIDHQPDTKEWERYGQLLDLAHGLEQDAMLRHVSPDGTRSYLDIFFLPHGPREEGILIARIGAQTILEQLMRNESPGYAIEVEWQGLELWSRGEAGHGLPDSWVHTGPVRNALDVSWNLTHQPSNELAESLRSPALKYLRGSGLVIAILMGLLLVETSRAEIKAFRASKAERAVSALNRQLEAKVRERTRKLAERSQDLITITESVGHDLRNPLNSISANIQLVEVQYQDRLNVDARRMLDQMKASLRAMTEILDRLLTLSTVFSSRFETEKIDMKELAQQIFDELYVLDPEPPARFEVGDIPDAQAEPMLIRTLLMNLIGNALKYSRHRDRRLIRMTAETRDGELVYLIQDNGKGFDENVKGLLFNAFERFDEHQQGLGLGLYIVARVVQRHEGHVWAEATPGSGATFYFTLGKKDPPS